MVDKDKNVNFDLIALNGKDWARLGQLEDHGFIIRSHT